MGTTEVFVNGTKRFNSTQAQKFLQVMGVDTYNHNVIIDVTTTKIVTFKAGDVYQYQYIPYGNWYTFVRGSNWSGDMTDEKMAEAIKDGRARKCQVVPV